MLQRKPTRIELKAEDKEEVRIAAALRELIRGKAALLPLNCVIELSLSSSCLQYEAVKEEKRQAELQAAAQQAGKAPLSPLFAVRGRAHRRAAPPSRCLLPATCLA